MVEMINIRMLVNRLIIFKFSPTLRIGDLNDFIAPSQACVVSLKGLKANSNVTKKPARPEVAVAINRQTEPVKISLKDCLACSGCITSTETVMLEKQSLDEFLSNIDKGKAIIVSLSPVQSFSCCSFRPLSTSGVQETHDIF
ncbi:unnamed protein product [Linum trigynum]|uniref:Uncharacterized protein n=1 Tax=Linum trigynum TaxID=586398 RepID=A0AAV2F6W9_9ROSI